MFVMPAAMYMTRQSVIPTTESNPALLLRHFLMIGYALCAALAKILSARNKKRIAIKTPDSKQLLMSGIFLY